MSKSPPATPDELLRRLDDLGLKTRTVAHPAVFTVEQARALRGDLPGAHSKNLFLKDKKGRLWLVVALADRQIDLKALRHQIGAATLSFGKPDLLLEVLGIEPGSVTPFAVINDTEKRVQMVLDKAMLELEPLNFHPLTNTATTQISATDLLSFLDALGLQPMIVEL